MTRFARAKGSKSSNERLPLESTPWHILKQQLESSLEKEQEHIKAKSAKQLLKEKDDPYYVDTLGNVSGDWAEFENTKTKTNDVKNGKVEKKSKDKNVKIKKAFNKSIAEENLTDISDVKPENVEIKHKNKKTKQKDLSDNVAEADNNSMNKKFKDNSDAPTETESNQLKNKKRKKEKNVSKCASINTDEENIKQERSDDSKNKKLNQVNNNTSIESDSNPLKTKKQKQNKSSQKTEDIEQKIKPDNDSNNKTEEHKEFSNKLSKRQKRNQKKQNLKTEIDNEGTNNATFNTKGNDWNNSVRVNKKRKADDSQDNNFVGNDNSQYYEERQFNNNLDRKNFNRFGNNVPRKFQNKPAKVRDDKVHARRKPDNPSIKVTINGMDVEIVKYDGFPIKKEDAERLTQLRKEMVLKGIPTTEINAAMKLERRKCEKALARIRKQVCFHCRKAGHNLSDCPELGKEEAETGICFKCGSTEHTHFECKVNKSDDYRYAKCFICREQGHIAKQCPDNPKGLYPDGGSCKICGDVTHLKKDCPDLVKEKEETAITLNTIKDENLESLDGETVKVKSEVKTNKKIVKF